MENNGFSKPVHINPDSGLSMPNQLSGASKSKTEEDREREFERARTRGYVVECDGEYATICAEVEDGSVEK